MNNIREQKKQDKAFIKRWENRPDFRDIKSFEEFNRYYWYREELSQICKYLGLEYRCTKKELNHIIEQYFKGNRVEKFLRKRNKNQTEIIKSDERKMYLIEFSNNLFQGFLLANILWDIIMYFAEEENILLSR